MLLALLPVAACATENLLVYQDRGNRFEGYQVIEVAGPTFEALSFTRGKALPALDNPAVLNVSFFLPQQTSVHISARELVPIKHYEMRAARTNWQPGWNTFGPWETTLVIRPLQIQLANLGVLARIGGDRPGSGELAAVQFASPNDTAIKPDYEFQFRTKYDLKKVSYRIDRVSTGSTVGSGVLYDVVGGAPASIRFQLNHQPAAEFRLYLDCLYQGRSGGPQRSYVFYHGP